MAKGKQKQQKQQKKAQQEGNEALKNKSDQVLN